MNEKSLVYNDVVNNSVTFSNFRRKCEQYANNKGKDIYLLKFPKSDAETSAMEDKNCFLFLTSDHKVAIINAGSRNFEDYVDDVNETFLYLYQKYNYRDVYGRYRDWRKGLSKEIELSAIKSIEDLINSLKIESKKEQRNVNMLIALAIGSINDTEKVGADVPESRLDRIKRKILLFDADQTRFIYESLNQPVVRIQGLSGTGKTELLLHKLKVLYTNKNKYKIFVTCHNKVLSDMLSKRIPSFFNFMKVDQQIEWNSRLWCTNAWGRISDEDSGLYRKLCSIYGIPYESYRKNVNTFTSVCRKAYDYLLKMKERDGKIEPAFDYILIDESQDFDPIFIKLCELVVSKQVYVAGDIFQSIFSTLNKKDYEAEYFLKKCYRTDPKTLMFSHALGLGLFEKTRYRWLGKDDWVACGYTYEDVGESIRLSRKPVKRFEDDDEDYESVILKTYGEKSLFIGVITLIKNILKENETATPDDFAIILIDDESYVYEWADRLQQAIWNRLGWEVNKTYESKVIKKNAIAISNRNNVKGLEFPFIICVTKGLKKSYTYRNSIYTMLSRSFLQSYLLVQNGTSGITDEILEGLKEINESKAMTIRKPKSKEEQEEIETRLKDAKKMKPLKDFVMECLQEMKIEQGKWDPIIQFVTSVSDEQYNEEDVRANICKLAKM